MVALLVVPLPKLASKVLLVDRATSARKQWQPSSLRLRLSLKVHQSMSYFSALKETRVPLQRALTQVRALMVWLAMPM